MQLWISVSEIEHGGDLTNAEWDIEDAGGRVIDAVPDYDSECASFKVECAKIADFKRAFATTETAAFSRLSR